MKFANFFPRFREGSGSRSETGSRSEIPGFKLKDQDLKLIFSDLEHWLTAALFATSIRHRVLIVKMTNRYLQLRTLGTNDLDKIS